MLISTNMKVCTIHFSEGTDDEEHLRHEVGSACAGVHNGHRAEVHLPDDSARLRKGVVHDHVQQRLQQSAGVVKGVLCQEECKPASNATLFVSKALWSWTTHVRGAGHCSRLDCKAI